MSYVCESDILWKVLTIWISRVLLLFNFKHLDILCPRIRHPSEMLWPFEFLQSFCYLISSVSIYYVPKSEFRAQNSDHSNFSRASIVQFQASRYILCLNRTSELKVMTIWIFREFPLFNFERLDILCPRIDLLCEILWPFEFLERFRCSISSVSIY